LIDRSRVPLDIKTIKTILGYQRLWMARRLLAQESFGGARLGCT
jgi:hypothetical protein